MRLYLYFLAFFSVLAHAGDEIPVEELIDTKTIMDSYEFESTDAVDYQHSADDVDLAIKTYEEINSEDYEDQAVDDAEKNSCDQGRHERIVCANIMCGFGAGMGEWPSECTDYKRLLIEVLATYPPWKSPPKCFMRDKDCNKSGRAKEADADEEFCMSMSDNKERHQCMMALETTTQEGAEDYVQRNGGYSEGLEDIEFIEKDPVDVATEFLLSVDERFAYRDDLVPNTSNFCDPYIEYDCVFSTVEPETSEMEKLSYFLENKDKPTMKDSWEMEETKHALIIEGTLTEKCIDVPLEEFYNCNFYPDLPQQCWAVKDHQSIVECIEEHEVVSS